MELVTGPTADLDPALLAASRALLFEVFDDMAEDDWEHALGGIHVVALDEGVVVGHAALVQRRLIHAGVALRTGYVEGVAVRPDRQRQGVGAAMMAELERHVAGAYEVGALGSTDEGVAFYLARGWQVWRGPLFALTPDGVVATEEEQGWVYVLPGSAPLDLDGELTADWRSGDVW